jgi:hypothetical protein
MVGLPAKAAKATLTRVLRDPLDRLHPAGGIDVVAMLARLPVATAIAIA